MTTFLPDTSTIIEALKRGRNRRKQLLALLAQGHTLACCAVTVSEIYSGTRPEEMAATEEFLSELLWFDVPFVVAKKAGRLRYEWRTKGVTLTTADTMIAATAIHYSLTLITENRKDFPMPELSIHVLN